MDNRIFCAILLINFTFENFRNSNNGMKINRVNKGLPIFIRVNPIKPVFTQIC
jgi:hypothetical protein